MGARIEWEGETLVVKKSGKLRGMRIDANPFIDATPLLATLACFAEGPTEIYNAAIARRKESDRLFAIAQELRKMGGIIEEEADGLRILPSPLRGATLFSHRDHRIALSLTVAALAAQGESKIEGADCIAKSYPHFASSFQESGARIAWR